MKEENDISSEGARAQKSPQVAASLPVDHSGTNVYLKGWRCADPKHPPIILVHDLGEHAGLYGNFAAGLVSQNVNVYGFDLRGHGRSGRRLGHAPSFKILINDLLQVVAWIRHQEQDSKPVLLGHGIGALIALEFARRHRAFCRALVLSSPTLELIKPVSKPTRFWLRLFADLMPTTKLPGLLRPRFTRDLSVIRPASSDAVTYFPRLTANFTVELLQAMDKAFDYFTAFKGRTLVLCPDSDTVCLYKKVKKSAAVHSRNNLQIEDLAGAHHNHLTYDETPNQQTLSLIMRFVEQLAFDPSEKVEAKGQTSDTAKSDASEKTKDIKRPGATKASSSPEISLNSSEGDLPS